MFTQTFQLIVVFTTATVIVLLGAYAVYCHNRASAFAHTGRLTDVQTWAMKSTLSWIATIVLILAAITPLIID
ncbi:hypothetical protein ACFQZI_12075 [Mucilaginibacter lutimaris]|uniref:Uncharacterized protein n=1 Tax=Mucilaginibacter lutimaris TaxID=931629 RepID=A0ABW2ZHB2_9SPHI